jgi:hypothetical protein
MKERPILFSAPMVRAILEGRKTQTRRVMKVQPTLHDFGAGGVKFAIVKPETSPGYEAVGCDIIKAGDTAYAKMPYGAPGDRLWVREAWAYRLDHDHLSPTQLIAAGVREAWFWADGPGHCCNTGCAGAAGRIRASMHLPRAYSRITLEITDVRVQRVQDISEEDARDEGVSTLPLAMMKRWVPSGPDNGVPVEMREVFAHLWDSINAKRGFSWASNPWVWSVTFAKAEPPQ